MGIGITPPRDLMAEAIHRSILGVIQEVIDEEVEAAQLRVRKRIHERVGMIAAVVGSRFNIETHGTTVTITLDSRNLFRDEEPKHGPPV